MGELLRGTERAKGNLSRGTQRVPRGIIGGNTGEPPINIPRAMIAARLANMMQGTRTDLQHSANLRNVISQPEMKSL